MRRCMVIAVVVFAATACSVGGAQLTNWQYNSDTGHWYARWEQPQTWLEAYDIATGMGAHLVTFSSAGEEAWVKATFGAATVGDQAWIGFTDDDAFGTTEGNFVWVTGEPITYTNWSGGEPNDNPDFPPGEDYAMMNYWGGRWNDLSWVHTQLHSMFERETPPPIGLEADPGVLWPPNNKMRDVALSYEVPSWATGGVEVAVSCSDPTCDIESDVEIVDHYSLKVRASRSGKSKAGREYIITVTLICTDGARVTYQTSVLVPHDQRK